MHRAMVPDQIGVHKVLPGLFLHGFGKVDHQHLVHVIDLGNQSLPVSTRIDQGQSFAPDQGIRMQIEGQNRGSDPQLVGGAPRPLH